MFARFSCLAQPDATAKDGLFCQGEPFARVDVTGKSNLPTSGVSSSEIPLLSFIGQDSGYVF